MTQFLDLKRLKVGQGWLADGVSPATGRGSVQGVTAGVGSSSTTMLNWISERK